MSRVLSPEGNGQENIMRGDAAFTLRIFDRHGIAIRYAVAQRNASYPNVEYRRSNREHCQLDVRTLGASGFGAVEWR